MERNLNKLERYLKHNKIRYLSDPTVATYGLDAYFHEHEPLLIIFGNTETELEKIANFLNTNNIKFCIRGSGTGYTGAAVPIDEKVILVTSRWDKIKSIDTKERSATVNSGVTPFALSEHSKAYGLRYPPDPASFKVCTLGGNVATNAGGPHCFLHGVTSNYIRKIRCLLLIEKKFITLGADSPYSLVYDIKDLFIGSGGTLGIFGDIETKLKPVAPFTYTFLISFKDYKDAISFINEIILEGIAPSALDMSTAPYIPKNPGNKSAKILLSIEGGSNFIEKTKSKIVSLVKKRAAEYVEGEKDELMEIRSKLVKENVTNTLNKSGKPQYFLFDAVVPRDKLGEILDYHYYLAEKLDFPLMNTFHAGDGNIHPTVYYNPNNKGDMERLGVFWYAVLKKVIYLNGAITGEHGIGLEKRDIFAYYEREPNLVAHKLIKEFFDLKGVLEPGKIFQDKGPASILIKKLEKLMVKYGIADENIAEATKGMHPKQDILLGVVEVKKNELLKQINDRLNPWGYFIPYLPIAFKEREVSFFINNNIPNILGHIFDLNDIVMGARIGEGSDGIEIGKPILKNVTGYSLKILINKDIADKNSSYYLKIFPKMNEFIPYKYMGFKTKKPQVLDKLLNVFGKSILNLVVNKSGEFLDLCVIVYNDKETLSAITKFLDSNSIKSSLANEIDIKPLDTKKIILVTLSKTPNFKEFDGFPEYTYSYLGKCLALPLKDKKGLDGIVKKVKSRLNNIEAIRKISGKGNEYLFVTDPLKKQLEITKELVEYLKAPGEIKMKGSFKPGYESNILKENEFEREILGEIRKCSRCGLCLYGCPQYQYKKEEQYSPRGVVSMIKSNRDKRFVKDFFKGCIKKCNNARPCESLCPTGLNFSKLISIYTKTCNYG